MSTESTDAGTDAGTESTDGPRIRRQQAPRNQTNGAPHGPVPESTVPSQRCHAKRTNGVTPCKSWAIVGATVCRKHGGGAPQVREAARKRILAFAPIAVQQLQQLATGAMSEAVRARAAIDLLDRAGLKAPEEHVVVPASDTNAALDEALLRALAARGHMAALPPGTEDQ